MELAFLKKHDPHNRKKTVVNQLFSLSGLISFLCGLLLLALINISLLLQDLEMMYLIPPQAVFIPGLLLGLVGICKRRGARTYTWWGLGLNMMIVGFYYSGFVPWLIYTNTNT